MANAIQQLGESRQRQRKETQMEIVQKMKRQRFSNPNLVADAVQQLGEACHGIEVLVILFKVRPLENAW